MNEATMEELIQWRRDFLLTGEGGSRRQKTKIKVETMLTHQHKSEQEYNHPQGGNENKVQSLLKPKRKK